MKKLLLISLLIGSLATWSYAITIGGVPEGPPQALATADYGGVDYDTSTFSSADRVVPVLSTGAYVVIYGVVFSSGSGSDFVSLRDSGTFSGYGALAPNYNNQDTFRIYNASNSNSGSTTGTIQILPKPVVFKRGLVWNVSTAAYNIVTVLIHRRTVP